MDQNHLNNWLNQRKNRRKSFDAKAIFDQLQTGSISALSTAITLLESTRKDDQELAKQLIQLALPASGKSIRIGITGVPGVGKSTFIESFGKLLIQAGKKVAILAIDPSSELSGGSILGDKTRMQELSQLDQAFIRPTAAGKTLGGVARKTRESIFLCEAAGFDVIIIETVGVGQSETMVHSMVDFFLLLMLAGAGDELQGIKRGIMEMADALVITKADGENIRKAKLAAKEYQNAMHLFPPHANNWIPKSLTCSSLENQQIDVVWKLIESFENQVKINGHFSMKRKQQDKFWFQESLKSLILERFLEGEYNEQIIHAYETNIEAQEISSFQAAEEAFQQLMQKNGN